MKKYLLDTGIVIHNLISQSQLNRRALQILADDSLELYLSAASSWEITIKAGTGKLVLPERASEFVVRATQSMSLRLLDITHSHVAALEKLPHYHRDPFDRMLIAQAQSEGLVLLTADRAFQRYAVETFWCGPN
jgi:PIN domain nuclease of toxin-antitoxin system